mgnify:CR=1 FL=1
MNKVSPKKLLNSKWTCQQPARKEKHFIIVEVDYDELGQVTRCIMQAVINRHEYEIDWRSLKEPGQWIAGWQ